ncbi:MAG: hypothetical protein LBJ72_11880 [Dysgonamonadaceae bacterium]|jgi:hypothetical protein|nr:hypothetical protein [Dysgonamonadaceae bacterium]
MAIIRTIDELKKTVKINKSTPWASLVPYIEDAQRYYLEPYLGSELLESLEENPDNSGTKKLLSYAQSALGPLAIALGTHELSIGLGDSGHTVQRNNDVAPASDAKVGKAHDSVEQRGWNNLEHLLGYLEISGDAFPEWESSSYYLNRNNNYLNSAREFQDIGKVNINYSRLTFEAIRPVLSQMEVQIRRKISPALDDELRQNLDNHEPVRRELINMIRLWEACKTAFLLTSKNTRTQRSQSNIPEYQPKLYPLYEDVNESGNYYAGQASYFESVIDGILNDNADTLGIEKRQGLNFNNEDRKIFFAG